MNSSEEQGGVVPSEKYKEALTTLKRKIFGDYTTDTKVEIESCAICLESFTQEDKIIEMNCDKRHIFHEKCIEDWLMKKLECPLCKKAVGANNNLE